MKIVVSIFCLTVILISGLSHASLAGGRPGCQFYGMPSLSLEVDPVIEKKITLTGVQTVCAPQKAEFTVEVQGIDRYSMAWRKKGRPDSLAIAGLSYTIDQTGSGHSGEYYCEIIDSTDNNKLLESNSILLTVYDLSLTIHTLSLADICVGDTVKLWAGPTRQGRDTVYQWEAEKMIGASDEDTLRAVFAESGQVILKASVAGCESVATHQFNIQKVASILPPSASRSACLGEKLVLRATPKVEGMTYRWAGKGITSDVTRDSASILFSDNGIFTLESRHGLCVGHDVINYSVNLFTAEIDRTGLEETVCYGDTLSLRAITTGKDVVYAWDGDGIIEGQGTAEVKVVVTENGEFSVQASDGQCTRNDTVRFAIRKYEVSLETSTLDSLVCYQEEAVIRAITATGVSFSWTGAGITEGAKEQEARICLQQDETFILNSSDGMCFSEDTIQVKVRRYDVSIVPPAGGLKVCYGNEFAVEASNASDVPAGATYAWSGRGIHGARNQAKVDLKVTDNPEFILQAFDGRCTVMDTITFDIRKYEVSIVPSMLVMGERQITINAKASDGVDFSWYKDDVQTSITTPSADFNINGNCTIVVKASKDGCAVYDTCQVKMFDGKSRVFKGGVNDGFSESKPLLRLVNKDMEVCQTQTAVISLHEHTYANFNYEWYKVGVDAVISREPSLTILNCDPVQHDGQYYCRVQEIDKENAYIYSDTMDYFKVVPGPIARILTPDKVHLCYGESFVLKGSPDGATSYVWTGPDIASTLSGQEAELKAQKSGRYQLVVTRNECSSTDTLSIYVKEPLHLSLERYLVNLRKPETVEFAAIKKNPVAVVTWDWHADGQSVVSKNGADPVSFEIAGSGKMLATLEDDGCYAKDSAQVVMFTRESIFYNGGFDDGYAESVPQVKIVKNQKLDFCEGERIEIKLTSFGFTNCKYTWWRVGNEGGSDVKIGEGPVGLIPLCDGSHTGRYYCSVNNQSVSVYSDTVGITVRAALAVRINGDVYANVCEGEEKIFTVDPVDDTYTYFWQGPGIVEGQNTSSVRVKPSLDGQYIVQVSKDGECPNQDTVWLHVKKPYVNLIENIRLYKPAKVRVALESEPVCGEVTWYVNHSQVAVSQGMDSVELPLFKQTALVIAETSVEGCVCSDSAFVFVKDTLTFRGKEDDGFSESRPTLRVAHKEIRLCEGNDTIFRLSTSGNDSYIYEWWDATRNKAVGRGKEWPMLHVSGAQAGFYYCKIINYGGGGELLSDSLKLVVNKGPVAKISEFERAVCYGSECHLDVNETVNNAGDQNYIYSWSGPGLENETGTSIDFRATVSGTYRVSVSDGGNCSSWDTITLTVHRLHADLVASLRLAGPQEVDFQLNTDADYRIEWFVNGVGQHNSAKDVRLLLGSEGRVVARVEDAACVDSAVCLVYMKDKPSFSVGATSNDGFAESRPQLQIIPQKWDFCAGSTVRLEVKENSFANYNYKWYRVGVAAVLGEGKVLTIERFDDAKAGKYYCAAVNPDNGEELRSDIVTLNYLVGPQVVLETTAVSPVCRGTEILLDGRKTEESGIADLLYRWEGDPGVSGQTLPQVTVHPWKSTTYRLIVTNPATQCADTASVSFDVNNPELAIVPERVALSAPGEYLFKAHNPEELTVTWGVLKGGTDLGGDATGKLTIAESCQVYVKAVSGGCQISDTCDVILRHFDFPQAGNQEDGFTESGMTPNIVIDKESLALQGEKWVATVCTRNPLRLNALVRGNGVYTYSWRMVGRETVYGESSKALVIPFVQLMNAGRYYCLMEDRSVSPALVYSSDTVWVEVNQGPDARILSPDDNTVACDGVQVTIQATDNSLYTYQWSTDGQILPETTPQITVSPKGSGIYVLKAEDEKGCSVWDTLFLKMNTPEIRLPEMIRLAAPQEVVLAPQKPEGRSSLNWYLNYIKDVPDLSDSDIGRLHVKNDCQIIVEIVQDGCSGYDTTHVFVKSVGTFHGGTDDGFALAAQGLTLRQRIAAVQVCRGNRAELEVISSVPDRVLRYEWRKKSSPDIVGTERILAIARTDIKDAAKYYCTAVDVADDSKPQKVYVSDTAEIIVLNGPKAIISFPVDGNEVCKGTVIQLDASETAADKDADSYEYEWVGENIVSGKNYYKAEAYAGLNGTYILNVTNGECMSSDTVRVKISAPEVSLLQTLYLAKKSYHTFSIDNPHRYVVSWLLENEVQKSTADTARILVSDNSSVIVRVEGGGCAAQDTCFVFVKDARPYVRSIEGDGFYVSGTDFLIKDVQVTPVACAGMSADFEITLAGNDFYRYAWKMEGSDRVVSTERSFAIAAVTKADEGFYYCEVTDVAHQITRTSNSRYLKVISIPQAKIMATPENGEVCLGEQVTLAADLSVLESGAEYSYLWIGAGISGQQSEEMTVTPQKTAVYTLTVGQENCFAKDTITLRVSKPYLKVPKVVYAQAGDNITLQAEATPGIPVNWRVNGSPYTNVNPLELKNVQASAEFIAETGGSCRVSDAGRIFVRNSKGYAGGEEDGFARSNGLPQIIDQSPLVQGCGVDSVSLFVKLYNNKGVTYTWQKLDELGVYSTFKPDAKSTVVGLGTERLFFKKLIPEDAGKYRCLVQNANGITDSKEMNIVKGDIPVIAAKMRDQESCVGTGVQFIVTATVKGGNEPDYRWFKSSTASNFEQLTPEMALNHPYLEVQKLTEAKQGYYMVEAWNLCGSVYDTAYLDVWEKPLIVRQNGDTAVCNEGRVRLWVQADGGGRYTYSLIKVKKLANKYIDDVVVYDEGYLPYYDIDWATSVDAGLYVWRVRNDCDSVRSSKPFTLNVESELNIFHELTDTTICLNTTIALDASKNVNSTPTTRYYWEKNGNRISTILPVHTIGYLSLADTGRYTCYAYTSCRAKAIRDFVVHKKERPVIINDLPATGVAYCEGWEAELSIKASSDAGDITYEWYRDNRLVQDVAGRVQGSKSAILNIDSIIGTDAGRYKVKLMNECANTTSRELQVTVNMPARYVAGGNLAGKDQLLCTGDKAVFQVNASGMTPIDYRWSKDGKWLKDAKSSLLQLNAITRADSGNYCCYISNGCMELAEKTCADLKVLTPLVYDVLGAGKYCGTEAGKEVTLSGFERDVVYRLYRKATDGSIALAKEVKGSDVAMGETLSFGLIEFGKYYVQALRQLGGKVCDARMNGEIDIIRDATPEPFDLYVSDPMCTGKSSGSLALKGSENSRSVEYILQKQDAGTKQWAEYGRRLTGTGSALTWKNMPAGIYRVMALNVMSGCQDQMGHVDTLVERPYPQVFDLLARNNDTVACAEMTSDVVLFLNGKESGCEYTLMKNGSAAGKPLAGNGIEWQEVVPGDYTVLATTTYGCKQEMGKRKVVEQPAPGQFVLKGDDWFCAEETGTRPITVDGLTQTGIRYDIYGEGDRKISELFGTGDKIHFDVPVKEADFYVMAVDTLHHCVIPMINKVRLTQNKLTLRPGVLAPIPAGRPTQLMLTVTGQVGKLAFQWEPADLLEPGQHIVQDPRTLAIDQSTRFSVTVNDSLCSKQAFVDVRIEGELLKTQIQLGDCYTAAPDTLMVCEGERVKLCSWTMGGVGDYRYRWSKTLVDSIGGGQSLSYLRKEDGYIYLRVRTSSSQEVWDSVWIKHRALPAKLEMAGSGLNCVRLGEQVILQLATSEADVNYRFEFARSAGGFSPVGESIPGGGVVSKEVDYSAETAGFYRIQAVREYVADGLVCSRYIDTAEIRKSPQQFVLSAIDNDTTSCAGMTSEVKLTLGGFENGCVYTLIKNEVENTERHVSKSPVMWDKVDPGMYSVLATSEFGCMTVMGKQRVVELPAPEKIPVKGGGYWCVGETAERELTLGGKTQKGIRYDVYDLANRAVPAQTFRGNGAPIVFPVPLKEKTYVVVATNTETGCMVVLPDTAYIKQSFLEISTEDQMVQGGFATQLDVLVKNAKGRVTYSWEPQSQIVDGEESVKAPHTEKLMHSERFTVTVSDDVCTQVADLEVTLDGDPLYAGIRLADCYTDKDTLFVCDGSVFELCSFVTGGAGSYLYNWTDKNHRSLGKEPRLKGARLYENGYVYLDVTTTVPGHEGRDSIWVQIRDLPTLPVVDHAGLNCLAAGESVNFKVNASETGILYTLEHAVEAGKFVAMGNGQAGNGGDLDFRVSFGEEYTGYYRISASQRYADGGVCVATVSAGEIRRSPGVYNLSLLGKAVYCEGAREDSIDMSGSETGVTYRLMNRTAAKEVARRTGDGSKVLFNGYFGSGKYEVIAEDGKCQDTMKLATEISAKSSPLITDVENAGPHCLKETPLYIKINKSLQGAVYKLCKEDGTVLDEQIGQANVALTFNEALSELGLYYISSAWPGNECTDTLRGISIIEQVQEIKMLGCEGAYCGNEEGWMASVKAYHSDPAVRYVLVDMNDRPVGEFGDRLRDTVYFNGLLKEGKYLVWADAGGCSTYVGQEVVVKRQAAVTNKELLGTDLIACENRELVMGVQISQIGIEYQLIRNTGTGTTEKLELAIGNGSDLLLGRHQEAGQYQIVATDPATLCSSVMRGEYKILGVPEYYHLIADDTVYCEGGRGVEMGISGTQIGCNYFLQVQDEHSIFNPVASAKIIGTGADASGNPVEQFFGGRYPKGVYRIVTDYCNGEPMLDTLTIRALPAPKELIPEVANACEGEAMEIVLKQAEAETKYMLYYKGAFIEDTIHASGRDTSWKISLARKGEYSVKALRGSCAVDFGSKIHVGETTTFGDLFGWEEKLCANVTQDLYLKVWDDKSTYELRGVADTVVKTAVKDGGNMVFKGILPGDTYYVVALNGMCQTRRGGYEFGAYALPDYPEENFMTSGCAKDGVGDVVLRNLNPAHIYQLVGYSGVNVIKNASGDTTYRNLPVGEYCLTVSDGRCTTSEMCETIREGIPATDTIIAPILYCESRAGASLSLSHSTFKVSYTILDLDGQVMEQLSYPDKNFKKLYAAGKYLFRKERIEVLGDGCSTLDTIEVKMLKMPDVSFALKLGDGSKASLCEAGNNQITIQGSEKNMQYILCHENGRYEDTLKGTGSAVQFVKRKTEGNYQIIAVNAGLCRDTFDLKIKVLPVPDPVTAYDCQYCYDPSDAEAIRGCAIVVQDMDPFVLYTLMEGGEVDRMEGYNSGEFKPCIAGHYVIVGTDPRTGCWDTVATATVKEAVLPQVFTVSNTIAGGNCAALVHIVLSGSEEDVEYFLYRDENHLEAGPVMVADGAIVDFGQFTTVGDYKVMAQRKGSDCRIWMDGLISIYPEMSTPQLVVKGYYCQGEQNKGVQLVLKNSSRGWSYFIEKDGLRSEVKAWNAIQPELTWDAVGGKLIREGNYTLYGQNACGELRELTAIKVTPKALPQKFSVQKDGKLVLVCYDESYPLELSGSQLGVSYLLRSKDVNNVVSDVQEPIPGTGERLDIANILEYTGGNTIKYFVIATVDSSGCQQVSDTLDFKMNTEIQDPGVLGADTCIADGAVPQIIMGVDRLRQPMIDWILKVDGVPVDTISKDAVLEEEMYFKPQHEFGYYTITGVDGKCEATYDGRRMSNAPKALSFILKDLQKICSDQSVPIQILNSEKGIGYTVMHDGLDISPIISGTGGDLTLLQVSEPGKYKVRAEVSECEAEMADSLILSRLPRPELHVKRVPETYCAGNTTGLQIQVTDIQEGVYYSLKEKGVTVANIYNQPAGSSVFFSNKYLQGDYVVEGKYLDDARKDCPAVDTLKIRAVPLPLVFDLTLSGSPYMCEGVEKRQVVLASSEVNVSYTLKKAGEPNSFSPITLPGTGDKLVFQVLDTGRFYVEARSTLQNACETRMRGEVKLSIPAPVKQFVLKTENDSYCYDSAPSGQVVLQGSVAATVEYQLLKDGEAYGAVKNGTGGALSWSNLPGKACAQAIGENDGFKYQVKATDKTTGCSVLMQGTAGIVEESNIVIQRQDTGVNACIGDSIALQIVATGCRLKYAWTKDGAHVGGSYSYYSMDSIRPEDIGVYQCVVSNKCTPRGKSIAPIRVKVRDIVIRKEEIKDMLVCGELPQNVQLVSTASAEHYKWMRLGDTLTLSSQPILSLPQADQGAEGEYVCYAYTTCGGLYDTCRLEFNRLPSIEWEGELNKTLCKGSEFALEIGSRDTIQWYKDEMLLDVTGNVLSIDSVTREDDGKYYVTAVNACDKVGSKTLIQQLNVDDTLKIVSASEMAGHYCNGTNVRLFIDMNQAARVTYKWYENGLKIPSAVINEYKVNALLTAPDNKYVVEYSNTCGEGSYSMVVNVDAPVKYDQLPAMVTWCAVPDGKNALRVKETSTFPMNAKYEWYYQKKSGDLPLKLASDSNVLVVPLKSSMTGDYYFTILNACLAAPVTSGLSHVKIDSVPQVLVNLEGSKTYCENDNLNFKIKVQGGDLIYKWVIRTRDGKTHDEVQTKKDYISESELNITDLQPAYDSCFIWCELTNDCATTYTDTTLVRVVNKATVRFAQNLEKMCPGNPIKVGVELKYGVPPLLYEYTKNNGEKILRSSAGRTDTLLITEAGEYRIVSLKSNSNWKCWNQTPEELMIVEYYEPYQTVISGANDICIGAKAGIRIQTTGGTGPWNVEICRKSDHKPAYELGDSVLLISSRDTVVSFMPMNDDSYYIRRAREASQPNACDATISGEATVLLRQPDRVSFVPLDKNNFGTCQTIDLNAVLKPSVASGKYYVDNRLLGGTTLNKLPGDYRVKYVTENAYHCVDSAVVVLRFDPLPVATITAKPDLCPKEEISVVIQARGTGPFILTGNLGIKNLDGHTEYFQLRKKSDANNQFIYPVYNGNTELMKIYEVTTIQDAHGCSSVAPGPSVNINMRKTPAIKIEALYEGNWTSAITRFVLPDGSQMPMRVTQQAGTLPWDLIIDKTLDGTTTRLNFNQINQKTWNKDFGEGAYAFTIRDQYCASMSEAPEKREVVYTEKGYLKVKAILEGAYDKTSGKMKSSILNVMPKNGIADWSQVVTGGRQIIDWVTIELRKEVAGEPFTSGKFLLLDDGTVVDEYGDEALSVIGENFSSVSENEYYVVIKQRNHLSLASVSKYRISTEKSSATLMDFTNPLKIYCADGKWSLHMKSVGLINGKDAVALVVGNVLNNSLISIANPNQVQRASVKERTVKGYYLNDVNFDGFVTWPDTNMSDSDTMNPDCRDDAYLIYRNRNNFSEIP